MRMLKALGLMGLMGVATATSGWAAVGAGSMEVNGQVNFTSSDSGDSGSLFSTIGYMASDQFEWTLQSFVTIQSSGDGDSSMSGSLGPGCKLYLSPLQDATPFVGLSYQIDITEDREENFDLYALFGGLNIFVSERTSLTAQLTYLDTVDDPDFDIDLSRTELTLGLATYF